jgi:Ca2+-binding RTX toxin-like protein
MTVALAATIMVVSPARHRVPALSGAVAETSVAEAAAYGNLPISFEPNVGQGSNGDDFVARGQGFGMAINATGATLALGTKAQDLVRMNLLEANPSANPYAHESLSGTVNYFVGNDPSGWRSDVPTFGRVSYDDIYPGIEVTYYGTNAGSLEYDFVVAPGANPKDIRLEYSGMGDIALRDGSLVITTNNGEVTQRAPVIYQTIAGHRIAVEGGFSLAGDEVGFEVGAYDHHHPIVIDPTLVYSTYLGGSGDEYAVGIAVDGAGEAYVTGYTGSTDFPTNATYAPSQGSNAGSYDAFVTKLNATGSARIYSTYLGGSGDDFGQGIAVDTSGAAYVTGYTTSTDFPMQAAFQGANAGGLYDAFLTKLDATGARVYSTYVGGSGDDIGTAIAVNTSGAAYVTGYTSSSTFPTPPSSGSNAGAQDAFAAKFDPSGSLVYSKYLGGSNIDASWAIAVDGSGAAYVAGYTDSTNFPTNATYSPFQGSNAGGEDAFVTKLDATGARVYSTYLGGSNDDHAWGIAVDGSGAAYVTGDSTSPTFPTPPSSGSNTGGSDAFVTKLNGSGALIYSKYLGGSDGDTGQGIAVDSSGAAYVSGGTNSTDFPTQSPLQLANGGSPGTYDGFVTKVPATGVGVVYSTYLGGTISDFAQGIAVDGSGAAYVAGSAQPNFPLQGPLQSYAGSSDAFVSKIADTAPVTCGGQTVTIQVTAPNLMTFGTGAADVINGTSGIDTIEGLGDNDIICGLGDNDAINGGKGNDVLYGDDGDDKLLGDVDKDVLNGGAGDDLLRGGDDIDTLYGDPGNDRLLGDAGPDTLYGDPGNDNLRGGSGADTLNGYNGDDTLTGDAGNDTLYGEPGYDRLYGGVNNDNLYGGDDRDFLYGDDGHDWLYGNDGSDHLYGNVGHDQLFGNGGADPLDGGPGYDTCNGGPPSIGDTGTFCEFSSNIP